jgi:hypothetical protein
VIFGAGMTPGDRGAAIGPQNMGPDYQQLTKDVIGRVTNTLRVISGAGMT